MEPLLGVLRVIHIVNAILMGWPFYALVIVNQRVRLGPPLGDRADVYMENVIKNRTIPCFVFQATALASGVALVFLEGLGATAFFTHPALALKLVLLLTVIVLLAYVHVSLQPRIDALFGRAGQPVEGELVPRIGALRLRRKRIASICLFVVLTASMLGVQVAVPFPGWLAGVLAAAIAVFTWRAYRSVTPWGWA